MKCINIIVFLIFFLTHTKAQECVYSHADSIKIEHLLNNAPQNTSTNLLMLHFANQLMGVPYVAKTLEKESKEKLVVNIHELDCTTLVENCLAMSLCAKNNKRSFNDVCHYLKLIRYADGRISYVNRRHYFTSWIDNAAKQKFVSETPTAALPAELYTAERTLDINFMSTHAQLYPALSRDKALVDSIIKTEKSLSGRRQKYIPKALLRNYESLKKHIRSGDIIVIVTKKQGLDTSHIGIASWHKDGTLHLLNASQIRKQVVDEPMTLFTYMQKHPSQIGIRVVHLE